MDLKLGRIVISEDLKDNSVIKSLSSNPIVEVVVSDEIFNDMPTIYVGWKRVKEIFKEQASIRRKKIFKQSDLFWTFAPTEKMQDFNEDLSKFVDLLYNDFIKNIEYHFLDPLIDNLKTPEDFVNHFGHDSHFDNTYITDDFLYIYDSCYNRIIGVDVKYSNFLKFSIVDLITKLHSLGSNLMIETYTTEDGIHQKYKKFLNKEVDKKYIPFIEKSAKKEFF